MEQFYHQIQQIQFLCFFSPIYNKYLIYFVIFQDKHSDYYHPEDNIQPDIRSMHIDNDNVLQLSINSLRHHCNNEKNITGMKLLSSRYLYNKKL